MTVLRPPTVLRQRLVAGALALAVGLAACTSGGSPSVAGSASPGASSSVRPVPSTGSEPTPVPVPSGPSAAPGAGQSANPGSGGLVPVGPGAGGSAGGQQATLVTPVPGLLNIHPVGAVELQPGVDGRRVTVRVSWWSGVEPCNVLAGVDVARDGSTITLTINEGAARLDVACIEIAVYKATIVDIGALDPGTYTIAAWGEATPVTVTVAG